MQAAVAQSVAQLPDELLSLIFEELEVDDLVACSRVCSRWRHILLSDATAWRKPMAAVPHAFVLALLAGGGQEPLARCGLREHVAHGARALLSTTVTSTLPFFRGTSWLRRHAISLATPLLLAAFAVLTLYAARKHAGAAPGDLCASTSLPVLVGMMMPLAFGHLLRRSWLPREPAVMAFVQTAIALAGPYVVLRLLPHYLPATTCASHALADLVFVAVGSHPLIYAVLRPPSAWVFERCAPFVTSHIPSRRTIIVAAASLVLALLVTALVSLAALGAIGLFVLRLLGVVAFFLSVVMFLPVLLNMQRSFRLLSEYGYMVALLTTALSARVALGLPVLPVAYEVLGIDVYLCLVCSTVPKGLPYIEAPLVGIMLYLGVTEPILAPAFVIALAIRLVFGVRDTQTLGEAWPRLARSLGTRGSAPVHAVLVQHRDRVVTDRAVASAPKLRAFLDERRERDARLHVRVGDAEQVHMGSPRAVDDADTPATTIDFTTAVQSREPFAPWAPSADLLAALAATSLVRSLSLMHARAKRAWRTHPLHADLLTLNSTETRLRLGCGDYAMLGPDLWHLPSGTLHRTLVPVGDRVAHVGDRSVLVAHGNDMLVLSLPHLDFVAQRAGQIGAANARYILSRQPDCVLARETLEVLVGETDCPESTFGISPMLSDSFIVSRRSMCAFLILDAATGRVVWSISFHVPATPFAVFGDTLALQSSQGDECIFLSLHTLAIRTLSQQNPTMPHYVGAWLERALRLGQISDSNSAIIATWFDHALTILDAETFEIVRRVSLPGPDVPVFAVSVSEARIAVACRRDANQRTDVLLLEPCARRPARGDAAAAGAEPTCAERVCAHTREIERRDWYVLNPRHDEVPADVLERIHRDAWLARADVWYWRAVCA